MALYDILEKQIIPSFYKRGVDNMPREWIARMKNCLRKLGPVFNTNRMVRDYTEKFYIPAAARGVALFGEGLKRSVDLAHAKDRLHAKWGGIRVVGVHSSGNGHYKVGQSMDVELPLDLGEVDPRTCRSSSTPARSRDRSSRRPRGDIAREAARAGPARVHRADRLPDERTAGMRFACCPVMPTWRRRLSRG
jgi:hypothetical protein